MEVKVENQHPELITNTKKFFKSEVDPIHNSNDAFCFCLGYIVALRKNELINQKESEKLIKYNLNRARRREMTK